MSLPLPAMETTDEQERWIEALYDAFDTPGSRPLEVAEEALRACPGDLIMLNLASVRWAPSWVRWTRTRTSPR